MTPAVWMCIYIVSNRNLFCNIVVVVVIDDDGCGVVVPVVSIGK